MRLGIIAWLAVLLASVGVCFGRATPTPGAAGARRLDAEILRPDGSLRMTTFGGSQSRNHAGPSDDAGQSQSAGRSENAGPSQSAGPSQGQGGAITVDGIAARIEGDIVTESQISELAGFQRLVDGKAGSRADLLRELTDQWIVKTEAQTARFSRPKAEDVTQAYDDLAKRYPSSEAFQKAIADAGITDAAVRRQLELQIFLTRFIDFKFRTAAQVSESEIQDYYQGEFTKQAQARGETVPPLEEVHGDIRRLLTEKIINERAGKWLDDARSRLRVEIVALPNKS